METTEIHISIPHCPFCKSEGIIIQNTYSDEDESGNTWYHPSCSNCPCTWEESYGTIQEAIDVWSKR